MKTTFMFLPASMVAAPLLAQTPAPASPAAPGVRVSGSVTTGVEQIDNSSGSSKLTEYRDLRDDFYLPSIAFDVVNPSSGTFFSLSAVNATRRDQTIDVAFGRPGAWNVFGDWNGIPHHYSNKAATPYIERAPGVFGVPATVPITFRRLATSTAADALEVQAMDQLVAAYQSTFLRPVPLAVQTDSGRFGVHVNTNALALELAYDRQDRDGYKWGFGPIGDRPPRTLNIQLTEPVDYATGNLQVAAEHQGRGYQVRGEFEYSDFANGIDTLRWQNIYTSAAPGADFDVWDRLVATTGARPLPPDNQARLMTGLGGVDVPGEGRVTAQFSYGVMEQDMALLPYSTFPSALANNQLPRSTASAEMTSRHFSADYAVNPGRVSLRAFFRNHDLENNTPSDRWQYVTQDTSNVNGTVSYVNKRANVAYASDRQNAGVDASVRLAARTTLGLMWEREEITRVHREADTTEHVLRLTLRSKPARWLSLRARYVQGLREGTEYDNEVTHEGYWYDLGEPGVDNNNPKLTFDNHPDTRRYDVSDRDRRQFDFTVNLTPRDIMSVSAFVRYRKDDFDSGVTSSQPLLDTTLAERTAATPGDQLGLLEDERVRYGLEFFVEPNVRATFNAFLNYDLGQSFTRSLEFNENNKANPSAIATAELGPWTRRGSQWTADTDDKTLSGGFGATLQLVPERLTLFADYTMSLTGYDLAYGGFGVTNWDGTPFPPNHQFAFSSPPTVNEDLQVFNLRVEIPVKTVVVIVGYGYETYDLADWQQSSNQPWVESVGADTLLRDTSRSFQWGNRLFNLGTYLAPSYDAHIGFVGLRYRF